MKIVFVLLARKNSIRIPGKIVKNFLGKPLIEWTLDFMQQFDYEKYVFTDSNDVKKICKNYDIKINNKLYENKQGIHHTDKELAQYNKIMKADILILLQATSPFRNVEKFKSYLDHFLKSNFDCGFAAKKIEDKYYYCLVNDKISLNYDSSKRKYNNNINLRNPLYKETGSFYIFKKEQIEKNHIMNGKIYCYEDDFEIDLDTLNDWEYWENVYENKNNC